MRCNVKLDSIFALHSHLTLFCIFFAFSQYVLHILRISFALFTTFWLINHEILTKKVEKVRKCKIIAKSEMQMQNENGMEKSAMRCAQ
jgi:hypothetical protein